MSLKTYFLYVAVLLGTMSVMSSCYLMWYGGADYNYKFIGENFNDDRKNLSKVGKIVIIDPRFLVLRENRKIKQLETDYKLTAERCGFLMDRLTLTARLTGLEAKIIRYDSLSPGDAYKLNELRRLQRDVLASFRLLGPKSTPYVRSQRSVIKREMIPVPRFRPEFAQLSQEYGTPYFMLMEHTEVYQRGAKTTSYALLVNVEKAEIVAMLNRQMERPARKDYFSALLHDFFRMIQKK